MKKNQKHLIAFLISVFAATYLMGQKTTIYFKKDSYLLSEKAKLRLDSLSDVLLKTNDLSMEIRLTGFTDADANEKYNQELSRQRALAVYEYLSTKGLMHQFEIIVRGENDPLNLNSDEHEKSINRRVEIDFQKKQKNYAYDVFKEKKQVFLINPEKDTVIICEKERK